VDQQGQAPPTAVSPGSSNVVRARLVIVSGTGVSGVFVYNGTPALGNPPIVSITSASADPFGNAVTPGLDVTTGLITGTTFLSYSGAPAAGNLVGSVSGTAGTDAFGNAYPAGITSYNAGDTFQVQLANTAGTSGIQQIFQNLAAPFSSPPFVEASGSGSAGSTLQLNSGQSGGGSSPSGVTVQDSTAAGRTNGQVTIESGGLSGQALLSGNTFQGLLSLPLPHQTTSNSNIASGAGTLSAADRTSLNGLINAVNALQANLQSAGMEL
jgi:hypothetical protein